MLTPEGLRQQVLKDLDGILSAPWVLRPFITADVRRRAQAMREYWLNAPADQLIALLSCYDRQPAGE